MPAEVVAAGADSGQAHLARGPGSAVMIAAAASITILDGFDAFSLSLMMPMISRELHIPTVALGPIFASVMGGMIVGAFAGGALADKMGRLRVLMVALALFAVAALTMVLVSSGTEIILNRIVAGIGLGAAAPVAVSLLNRSGAKPPSALAVSLVWAGIGIGGTLAAAFAYLFSATLGWRVIFLAGGIVPIPVAIFALIVFRGSGSAGAPDGAVRPRLSDLFRDGRAVRTLAVAGMFFFGFVTTSIIVNWLPTILSHRAASPALISASFAGINVGAVLGTALLGWVASLGRSGAVRTLAWAAASVGGVGIALVAMGTGAIALLAVTAAIIGVAAQALSIALANEMHRAHGLQSTTVGFMAGCGRLGQFSALGISSAIVAWSGQETMVFGLAGLTALAAALLSSFVAARAR